MESGEKEEAVARAVKELWKTSAHSCWKYCFESLLYCAVCISMLS